MNSALNDLNDDDDDEDNDDDDDETIVTIANRMIGTQKEELQ